jgi:hypothetical protein
MRTTIEESFQGENWRARVTIITNEVTLLGVRPEDRGTRVERSESLSVENFRKQGEQRYMRFESVKELDEMIDVLYQAKEWLTQQKEPEK